MPTYSGSTFSLPTGWTWGTAASNITLSVQDASRAFAQFTQAFGRASMDDDAYYLDGPGFHALDARPWWERKIIGKDAACREATARYRDSEVPFIEVCRASDTTRVATIFGDRAAPQVGPARAMQT